ncbi:DUF1120 domain-containing protein [Enterobacter hormaechei]|uniref:DUF1120 domain-containing protein n=1 Tax=Enterobacter hormaechei TaxID=158836 RepID=UPI0011DCA44C|nr:DUF1120 domain-containing protein [Enterobacter hormaechei]TXU05215.1 DUF1120 domain-containing protein [Enterobacter hormaechei]
MKFNKTLPAAVIAAALGLSAFGALAANDVTLKVIGTINPAACTPTLPDGGIVDYGTILNRNIAPTGATNKLIQLGQKSITLNISCESNMSVAFTSTDNRLDSRVTLSSTAFIAGSGTDKADFSNTTGAFGLGKTTAGVNIGAYTVAINTAAVTADGANVDTLVTGSITEGQRSWEKVAPGLGYLCSLNGCTGYQKANTVATTGTTVPKTFRQLSVPLLVTSAVQDNSVLGTKDVITLDGNATISLVYL